MGSQWTNKYAILRDLSVAQGRKVPAEIVGSVGVGQKPPALNIKEDNEEEFFQNYVGDGNLYTKPDLSLIKEMINMVKESDPVDEDNVDKIVEISKLNPLSKEFKPKIVAANNVENTKANDKVDCHAQGDTNVIVAEVNNVDTKQKMKTVKKRRERNVAILSLLEKEHALDEATPRDKNVLTPLNGMSKNNPEEITRIQNSEKKLLKPNDFIIDCNITESVEKVNEWLQKPVKPPLEKAKPITLSPGNMFQKRKPVSLSHEGMFKKKSDTSSIKSSDSDTVPKQSDNVFVPSTHANEYYKKFVERRQVQEKAKEDIWKRAERLMKEIDAKRLKENEERNAELLEINPVLCITFEENDEHANNEVAPSLPIDIPGLAVCSVREAVLLPQHRHDLPEECAVCLAVAKHKRQTALQDNHY